jgi:pyruvate/2-oxoglutarate dehydrogenase complex dihydrolipoamide dehydrogenase (E3) component
MPRVTFTDPEIGAVGLTEAAARDAGIDVAVVIKRVPATFRGWIHGSAGQGVIKLVAERSSGILIGATSAGPHGGEVLGALALAVHARLPLATLRNMIFPYPTFYGGIGEAIGAYGRGIMPIFDPDTEPLLEP